MKIQLTILLCFAVLAAIGQCSREVAVNDYLTNYEPNEFNLEELAFTGNIDACITGSYAASVNQKMLKRINYLRRLVRVSDDIVFNASLNQKCLKAAVMQEANRIISHCYGENNAPCDMWLCNSPVAIEASQNSLLAIANWNYFDPIRLYTYDGGALNTGVSHRRWLLYSKAKVFGNGLTENRNVMYVIGNSGNPSTNQKDFIAYPAERYMPAPLVFPRWSFTIPDAYFGNATVQMIDENGNSVNLTIVHKVGGFPEPAIVWEPDNILLTEPQDVFYTITISGIEDAPQTSYTYTTIIIQPVHPPTCLENESWSTSTCSCIATDNCVDTLALNNTQLTNGLYAANLVLMAENTLNATSNIEFNAGKVIELLKNFEVKVGADFLVDVDVCN